MSHRLAPHFRSVRSVGLPLLLLLCMGIFAPLANAAAPGLSDAQKPRPFAWPEGGRPRLTYREVTTKFDNIPMVFGHLSGAGFDWVTNISDNWTPMVSPPDRYSISFRQKDGQPLIFGLSVFEPEEFLPDLTAQSWERYLDGLRDANGEPLPILSQSSAIDDPTTGPHINGEPARLITFRRPGQLTGASAELDLFVFLNKKLVVYTLTGPERQVVEGAEDFLLLIGNFAAKE